MIRRSRFFAASRRRVGVRSSGVTVPQGVGRGKGQPPSRRLAGSRSRRPAREPCRRVVAVALDGGRPLLHGGELARVVVGVRGRDRRERDSNAATGLRGRPIRGRHEPSDPCHPTPCLFVTPGKESSGPPARRPVAQHRGGHPSAFWLFWAGAQLIAGADIAASVSTHGPITTATERGVRSWITRTFTEGNRGIALKGPPRPPKATRRPMSFNPRLAITAVLHPPCHT